MSRSSGRAGARRIESGRLRGRRLLELPPGIEVRPTSARVRGAIFDRLQGEVDGARVLDVFAGSGALALEALSRGAASATLIEREREVVRFLRRQLAALDLEDAVRVEAGDALAILADDAPAQGREHDIVLVDPPYADAERHGQVARALVERGWLAPGAVVVFERERVGGAAPPVSCPPQLVLETSRRHGQTVLDFTRYQR